MSVQLRRRRAKRPAPSGPLTAAALLLAAGALWAGCSVEQHYDLLSLFFDGVPRPAGMTAEGADGAPTGRRVPGTPAVTVSAHTAYAERRCEACHGASSNFGFVVSGFSKLSSDSCLECHGDAQSAYPWMHGPVAAGACLWCHQPHDSPYPVLLKRASPGVCLQCHQFELQGTPLIPEHEDLARDCLACHHGHGGDAPHLLRAAAGMTEPVGATEGPG